MARMSDLPKRPMTAEEWSHAAWGDFTPSLALTVPRDALQALLDERAALRVALEDKVRAEMSERAESIPTIDAPTT